MGQSTSTTTPAPTMTTCYSYVRFSSKKQELSDSKRRQIDMATKYAVANGLTLDPSGFEDLGVSAFRGKNSTDGALGDFLRCVDAGLIPHDSWLLVESLDRVSGKVTRGVEIDATLMIIYIKNTIITNLASIPPTLTGCHPQGLAPALGADSLQNFIFN